MKGRWILKAVILALAGTLVVSSAAWAGKTHPRRAAKHSRPQRHMMMRKMHHPPAVRAWLVSRLAGELAITPEQRARLNDIGDAFTDRTFELIERYYSQPTSNIPRLQRGADHLYRSARLRALRILNPAQRRAFCKYLWTHYSTSIWDEGGVSPGMWCGDYFAPGWRDVPAGMRPHRGMSHRFGHHRDHDRERPLPQ